MRITNREMLMMLAFVVFIPLYSVHAQIKQKVLEGVVLDDLTGETIPFANVYLKENPKEGAISDMNGGFKFKADFNEDSVLVVASFIGYLPNSIWIKKTNLSTNLEIRLKQEVKNLDAVVFEAPENPAYEILRQAIDRKKENYPMNFPKMQFKSYSSSEVYINELGKMESSKLFQEALQVIRKNPTQKLKDKNGNDIIPLMLTESYTDNYKYKQKSLEKTIHRKVTGIGLEADDNLMQIMTGNGYKELDFYRNNISVMGKYFTTPLHNSWRVKYEYWLIDSLWIDNDFCYEIDVEPKAKGDLVFEGKIWITKNEYALKKLDLKMSEDANINFIRDIRIKQELESFNNKWLVSREYVEVDLSDIIPGLPGLLVKFENISEEYNFNSNYDLSIFEDKFEILDNDKHQEDEEYWNSYRSRLFSSDSSKVLDNNIKAPSVYTIMDSIKAQPRVKVVSVLGRLISNGYHDYGKKFELGHYLYLYAFNNVEGNRVQFGVRSTRKFSNKWLIKPSIAYGFADQKFKHELSVHYSIKPERAFIIGVNSDYNLLGASQIGTEQRFSEFFVFSSRWFDIRRRNPYYRLNTEAFIMSRFFQDLTARLYLRHQNIEYWDKNFSESLPRNTFFPGLSKAINLYEGEVNLRYSKKEKVTLTKNNTFNNAGNQPFPTYKLIFYNGVYNDGNNNKAYQKLFASINHWQRPIGSIGVANIKLKGGYIFSTMPYQLLKIHQGNESSFYLSESFQMMNNFEFVSDRFMELKYEHFFEGLLMNRVPLLKKLNQKMGLRTLFVVESVWGGMSEKNKEYNKEFIGPSEVLDEGELLTFNTLNPNIPYYDLGIGVESIFRVLRVDLMRRMNYNNVPYEVQNWSVKFSAQIKF